LIGRACDRTSHERTAARRLHASSRELCTLDVDQNQSTILFCPDRVLRLVERALDDDLRLVTFPFDPDVVYFRTRRAS
jgi:hypothetical protein